ncbi:hypothetical protein NE555_16340, partial [Alistipes onderdonkii]|uniref:hypothetical protein n=1 Tax=Alistipes onderdonkii TaxID=328813 RepID=UPI00210DF1F9
RICCAFGVYFTNNMRFSPKVWRNWVYFFTFVKIEMRASAEFAFAGQNGRCGWLSEKDVINQFF